MPGEISRSNPGPKGNTPYVPSWVPPLPDECTHGQKIDPIILCMYCECDRLRNICRAQDKEIEVLRKSLRERNQGKRRLTGKSPEVQGARNEPADFM
jgi:hypothetical protein